MPLVKEHYHEVADEDLGDPPIVPGPGPTGPQGDPGTTPDPAANVAAIADTSVATAEDVGDKVNELLSALKDAGFMEADA